MPVGDTLEARARLRVGKEVMRHVQRASIRRVLCQPVIEGKGAQHRLLTAYVQTHATSEATELLKDVVEPLIVVSLRLLAKLVAISAAAEELRAVFEPLTVVLKESFTKLNPILVNAILFLFLYKYYFFNSSICFSKASFFCDNS